MLPIPKKDTVLKTLIALGVIGIGISLFIQYGQPYLKERALEKLDKQRISDLDTLNTEIKSILATSSTTKLGENNTVYISVPSNDSTCKDLDLPSLAEGWKYHCVTATKLQNADGKGWIPVNFKKIKNSGLIQLSIDPINNQTTLNYYAFVTNAATTTNALYTLTATMDSRRYLLSNTHSDNILDSIRYETGNDANLWASADSLMTYWLSQSKSNLMFINNPKLNVSSSCFNCLILSGQKNILQWQNNYDFSQNRAGSYTFSFKIPRIPEYNSTLLNPGTSRFDVNLEGKTGALFVWYEDKDGSKLIYKSAATIYANNEWHQIILNKDENKISIYIDGQKLSSTEITSTTKGGSPGETSIPNSEDDLTEYVMIKDYRLFGRSLTGFEILKLETGADFFKQ